MRAIRSTNDFLVAKTRCQVSSRHNSILSAARILRVPNTNVLSRKPEQRAPD